MGENINLPDGWTWTTLGDVFKWGSGGTPLRSKPEYYDGDIPWVIIGDLNDSIVTETQTKITQKGLEKSSAKWVEEGSVLIAMYGSIGKLGIAGKKLTTNQAIAFTKPDSVNTKYLFYYLMGQRFNLLNRGVGATQQNISQTIIKAYPFPLSPRPEQDRIVERIESLFTQLDAGVAGLKRAQAALKRYRASVLKAAVEGELSRDWREAHQGELEPASVLLERILAERKAKWEAEGGKGKYKEPAPPDKSDLPELPDRWVWVSLGQLIKKIEAGKSFRAEGRPARNGEYGVIKVSAMSWGKFLPEENKALYSDADVTKSSSIKAGDLLISRANTVELVGAVVLVDHDYPKLLLSDKSLRLVFCSGEVDKKYILHALRSQWVRTVYERLATGTSDSMRNLSQDKIMNAPIALQSFNEQQRIAEEVERRLSVIDELERSISKNITRAERLRQAILKRAFEGKLVEQRLENEKIG